MDLTCLTLMDILAIFNKMTCRSLCQMQQTCKWIAALQTTYRRYTYQSSHQLRVNLNKSPETFGFFCYVQNMKAYPVDVPSVMPYTFTHVEFVADGTTDRQKDHCNEEQKTFLMKVFSLIKWTETRVELSVNICQELLEIIQPSFVSASFFIDKLPESVRTHAFQMDTFSQDWHPLPYVEKCVVKTLNIITMISSLRTIVWDWYMDANNSLTLFETGHWCHSAKQSKEQILRNISSKMFPWLESYVLPQLPASCDNKIHDNGEDLVSARRDYLIQRPDGALARISFLIEERSEYKAKDTRYLLHRLMFTPL